MEMELHNWDVVKPRWPGIVSALKIHSGSILCGREPMVLQAIDYNGAAKFARYQHHPAMQQQHQMTEVEVSRVHWKP